MNYITIALSRLSRSIGRRYVRFAYARNTGSNSGHDTAHRRRTGQNLTVYVFSENTTGLKIGKSVNSRPSTGENCDRTIVRNKL